MQRIIDNLTHQHKDLVRAATELFGWLDPSKLAEPGAQKAFHVLSRINGILNVHLAMEDRSLYPKLIKHGDPQLRALAQRFLDERGAIADRYDAYRGFWSSPAAIVREPVRFIDETRLILGLLWNRMKLEDDVFHPEILRVFAD
jgi:hypothetical protein